MGPDAPAEGFPPSATVTALSAPKRWTPDMVSRILLAQADQYDAVYVLKAAVEGTGGKTDGPSIAAWVESNSGSFKNINSGLTATGDRSGAFGALPPAV